MSLTARDPRNTSKYNVSENSFTQSKRRLRDGQSIMGPASPNHENSYIQDQLRELQIQGDYYAKKVEIEKRRGEELDMQLKVAFIRILHQVFLQLSDNSMC